MKAFPVCRLRLGLSALLMCMPFSAGAQEHGGHQLGKVEFPISCSPEAQAQFNHALAFLHHMTYPQARAGFEGVAKTDPQCAMAHWGIAMTLFQPLWPTRPSPEALRRGWEAVQKAKALKPPTERERLFVAAAEAFFLEPASPDYWLRIRRWEKAMEKVYAALPGRSRSGALLRARAPRNRAFRHHLARACRSGRRNPPPHL